MPDAAPTISSIGTTTYQRFIQGAQTFTIQVQQVSGKVAAHYASSMQVDADGAPKGYHEGDNRPYQNNHDCFDWLENLSPSDRHGQQGVDGAIGPAQGFTISATSLCDPNVTNTHDTARYVDASTIPFVVLPGGFPRAVGQTGTSVSKCLGCLCYVINLKTGNATGAVFADVGPHVGEASLATALRLGCDPFYPNARPKVAGMDSKRFFTIVFPNEILAMPLKADDIEAKATAQFQAWGGWDGLAAALKQVPKESPHTAPDDDIATLTLPPFKGPAMPHPVVMSDLIPPNRNFLATSKDTTLMNSPDGDQLAAVPAGTSLEVVEALPHGDWLRVFATINGELTQGYVAASATKSQ
jgi:Fungal chitosanase of glycosyl hydrolase group 75